MAAVEREAAELGLAASGRLAFVDPGEPPTRLLSAIDVFALTSVPNSEGMPTAILEAMALGIPVVATDVGSVRELVEDGVTGVVVPAREPTAIAAATATLLDDSERRERIGAAARERAATRFALDRLVELHAEAYRKALAYRRAR
jgi:glycosyltransferase involved in cell wall biosynthesis